MANEDENEARLGHLAVVGAEIERLHGELTIALEGVSKVKEVIVETTAEIEATIEQHDQLIGAASIQKAEKGTARGDYEIQALAEDELRLALEKASDDIAAISQRIKSIQTELVLRMAERQRLLNEPDEG